MSYFKFHADLLVVLYRRILCATDKAWFAKLFNLRSMLLRRSARVEWDGACFRVTDWRLPGVEYRFRHQRQGNMAYERGLVERGISLGKDYLLDRIPFAPSDLFIDCGANTGDIKLWFLCRGIEVNYVAFEPSPVEFECLAANVAPSTVYNLGLWNSDGSLQFYVSSQGADSSLIEPPSYDEVIRVRTGRLDQFIDRPVKCLKLEAEGAEPEIIEGLGESINFVEYLTADLWFERGVTGESTFVPVTNMLIERGFDLVEINYRRLCVLFRNRRFQVESSNLPGT